MIETITLLAIIILTAFLIKLTDLLSEHGLKLFKFSELIFGAAYGILIGYTVVYYPIIAPLWLGTVIANTIYGRVDAKGHYVAFGALIVTLILLWNFKLNIWLLIIFIIAAVIDEILDDFQDKKKKKIKLPIPIRPILDIVALIVSIIIGNFIYLLAIVTFDIAYDITKYLGEKKTV